MPGTSQWNLHVPASSLLIMFVLESRGSRQVLPLPVLSLSKRVLRQTVSFGFPPILDCHMHANFIK
jgi:hypothetical protein